MAELNSAEHLVRHDKDTIVNGYDNEAYHPQTDDGGDETANDEDHLRSVVTDNGHPVSNGHSTTPVSNGAPVSNGRSTTPVSNGTPVNGRVVASDMDKPLDTRLHHYVPVEDIDKKILNGSETHVAIPDDAVINYSSGRVKVKKTAADSPRLDSNRDSIPLEDIHPPCYGDDKKPELLELPNHKNGVWTSGEAYGSAESHFISEKLNGKSKTSGADEAGKLPVNNHRKCLSRESSISTCSSEHKPTGEKLYFNTEDSRKICPNLKRGVICGIIVVVISVVLLLCVLAATGIILSKSEATRYESGHSLPSMDSVSHAGHSFRPHPKVPRTEDSHDDAVTSKVPPPPPNEPSHSQTTVPNALVGEFTIIDENFTDDLNDNTSQGYMNLARNLETELHRIFRENGAVFDTLKILNFRPGSIKVKFVVIWSSDNGIILFDKATEILSEDLRQKNNSFYNFVPVDINSIHFVDVYDECRIQKGGCSFDCMWSYDTLSKTCICQQHMYLLPDGKTCALISETSSMSTTVTTSSHETQPVPTLPTLSEPETTISEVNHTSGSGSSLSPFPDVMDTKEPITTQSSIVETSTMLNRPVMENTEHGEVFPTAEAYQTYPETTTLHHMHDGMITETSENITEKEVVEGFTNAGISSADTATENPLFNFSTGTSLIVNILETNHTDTIPTSVDSITEQTLYSITTENLETAIPTTEPTVQPVPEIPIATTDTTTLSPMARTEETTIKFHVVEPTTEVYTFNPMLDYTSEYAVTSITSSPSDQEETILTESSGGTDLPVTSNVSSAMQPDTDNVTLPSTTMNISWTLPDVHTGPQTVITTMISGAETDLTEPTVLLDNVTMFSSEGSEIGNQTIWSVTLSRNETEDTTTSNPEMSTLTSASAPYSNRTSGVRYIDDFTDLYENITDNRFLNTDEMYTETVTGQTLFSSDSAVNTTTNYSTSGDQFTDTESETIPTEKSPFWIKKIANVTDYTSQGDNFYTTEPASETEIPVNLTTYNFMNLTSPPGISINDSFNIEDEVHLQHENNTLTLPPYTEEPETTIAGFESETTPMNNLSTSSETVATTHGILIPNNTVPLPFTDIVSITELENTTLLSEIEENTFSSNVTDSNNQTFTETYLFENETEISTVLPYSRFDNISDIPPLFEDKSNDSTTLLDSETAFTMSVPETTNVTSDMEISNLTLPTETTFTDILTRTIPTAIFDVDVDSTTLFNESLPTNKSDAETTISTEATLYTANSNTNETYFNDPANSNTNETYFNDTANSNTNETYFNDTANSNTNETYFNDTNTQTTSSTVIFTEILGTLNESDTESNPMNDTETYETTFDTTTLLANETDSLTNHTFGMETFETSESSFISNTTKEETTTIQAETSLIDGNIPIETSTVPYSETTPWPMSFANESLPTNDTELYPVMSNTTSYNSTDLFDTEEGTTFAPYLNENSTDVESNNTEAHYNWKKQDESLTDEFGYIADNFNDTDGNYSFAEDYGNYTSTGFEGLLNETTTNATTIGIVCREDQFICEPLNLCINSTFMCDGIQDCPDGVDEFNCQESCGSNFRCSNSSNMCIMSQAHCDGIWDCENGTDEENCSPIECAKHEVICLDKSKCIRPSDICDLKYDCKDRSDEVGCVERTTCESGGKFFCNDGLCIPWSLKCDGEFDCKDKEDEGNCTCLNDEFQCNDGKCLKSSSRCDGHKDCHDADDEMGCINVDSQHIVTTYEPYSGTWALLCAEDFNLDDGHYLCQELGFGHALKTEKLHVSFNGTWMAMRRENLTDASLWTERVSFVESCTSASAAVVECQKFACGEYSGLLHRRKRDVLGPSSTQTSTQWPFIGYTSTFTSNRGCMSEILTPIWLITSAECLLTIREPFNGSDWYVRTNIGRGGDSGLAQNHEVLRIVSHPHSSKFRSLILRDYDVALVRLKHALVFVSDKIGAICPPEEQVPPGITCFSGVLGTQKPRAPPPTELTINSLALQIMERKNCNSVEHYNNQINTRMLCTQSSEGHTICDNDEGTPLMCLTGINKWFLAGMLTYQRYCEVYSKHPAVFSNLFAMRKFIDQVTGQKQYEVAYNPGVYVIIPPTTPSPTVPETTTFWYTTTEDLNGSDFTTDWMSGMFNDSEAETTTAMSTMMDVAEFWNGTTVENMELRAEELLTTTSSAGLTMDGNFTDVVEMDGERNGTEDMSNLTTTGFEVMDNATTLSTAMFGDDVNSTVAAMFDDAVTLQDQYGFGNMSEVDSELYDGVLFNTSGMLNKTHDAMMVGLTTDFEFGNLTEFFNGSEANFTEEFRTETTKINVMDETVNPFFAENATSLDILNSTMIQVNADQILPISNETSFVSPERLTLTTLHSIINGETTIEEEINSTVINSTEFYDSPLTSQHMSLDYTLTGLNISETTMTTVTDTLMKSARFESETDGFTDYPYLINDTTLDYESANATIELETQSVPTEYYLTAIANSSDVFDDSVNASISYDSELNNSSSSYITERFLTDTGLLGNETDFENANYTDEALNATIPYELSNGTSELVMYEAGTGENFTLTLNNETANTQTELETSTNPATTLSPRAGTFIFDAEVGTGTDLSLTLNDSHEIIAEPVASVGEFGNFQETNHSTDYLSRGRMIEYYVNASISYDPELNNSSSSNVRERFSTDARLLGNETGFENATFTVDTLNDTFPYHNGENATFTVDTLNDTFPYHNGENATFTVDTLNDTFPYHNGENATFTVDTLNDTFPYHNGENATFTVDALNDTFPYELSNLTSEIVTETTLTAPVTSIIANGSSVLNGPTINLRLSTDMIVSGLENVTLNNTDLCGTWNLSSDATDGKPFFAVWPSLGYLQRNRERCPTTLLSDRFVVTSLHCLQMRNTDLDARKWYYTGGLYTEDPSIDGRQNHLSKQILTNLNTTLPSDFNSDNFALVMLDRGLSMNKNSEQACLPEVINPSLEQCYTTGWSKGSAGKEDFFTMPVDVISTEVCNNSYYNGQLTDNLICATLRGNLSTCEITPGAPLLCLNSNNNWDIQGILTTHNPCITTEPAVFHSIHNIREWISETMTTLLLDEW